jgi:hypothetical protein
MTEISNSDAASRELSMEELDMVGGAFSFSGWLKAVGTGAAIGGAIGNGPGAIGGAVFGSVGYFLRLF